MATIDEYGGLGNVYITPAALQALARAEDDVTIYLERHRNLDWGTLNEQDKKANEAALASGARLMSAYQLKNGEIIWIITEACIQGRREATTILLPEDY